MFDFDTAVAEGHYDELLQSQSAKTGAFVVTHGYNYSYLDASEVYGRIFEGTQQFCDEHGIACCLDYALTSSFCLCCQLHCDSHITSIEPRDSHNHHHHNPYHNESS